MVKYMYNFSMKFEWDENKNKINIEKHGVSFEEASKAFFDKRCVITKNLKHSVSEKRFYCFGKVNGNVLTVRFTVREGNIRIIGAGYWRDGRKKYEEKNNLH
jgi:uncharacterized DUF497 family protein